MQKLLSNICQRGSAEDILLQSGTRSVSRSELLNTVEGIAEYLSNMNVQSVALYADNGIDWILTDLACQVLGIRIVPVPLFFSTAQIQHTILSSGATVLVTDQENVAELVGASTPKAFSGTTNLYALEAGQSVRLPEGTQKITFTSGTTGSPKGVCLSSQQQLAVAASIAAVASKGNTKHL